MSIRYTDLDAVKNGANDFVVRKRRPTSQLLSMAFAAAFILSFILSTFISDKFTLACVLFGLFSLVGAYAVLTLQRNHDLMLTTEFQNALFASALGLNNKFCIIIRNDGNISYLDRAFQEMFPNFAKQSQRGIAVLLDQGRVSKEDSAKIFAAIERGVLDRVVFDISDYKGIPHNIVMTVEPIMRPSGFILLRGREFIDKRSSNLTNDKTAEPNVTTPPILDKSNITLFSYVMDSMNMGVYMTGPSGSIIYANPILEQWLEYNEGEIAARILSLQDIIHQTGKQRSETLEPTNYEGEVILIKKSGALAKAFINQKTIRDERDVTIGCTALLHGLNEHYAEMKKKLW